MRSVASVVALFVCLASPAPGSGIDSEHLFGLTEGSDIGTAGEREVELEFGGRFSKGSGTYRVLSQVTALKLTLTDSLRVAPFVGGDLHYIRRVPGLIDQNRAAFAGGGFEMKYRALDRQSSPVGLTLAAVSTWGHVDDVSGERVTSFGGYFTALADRELVAGKLLGALNLIYATGASRMHATGAWEHDSTLAASTALSGKVTEGVFVGGEVRYERAYDGMGLDRLTGYGMFIGPSLYARISDIAWISAVWNAQVTGRATGMGGSFDLTNFERHLVKLRLGVQF
jgi:hypothetical protein